VIEAMGGRVRVGAVSYGVESMGNLPTVFVPATA
jgi:hypothetical protein